MLSSYLCGGYIVLLIIQPCDKIYPDVHITYIEYQQYIFSLLEHMIYVCIAQLFYTAFEFQKSAGNSGQQSLQKRMIREALDEDASVFQYDEIYDEMQANKSAQVAAKKQAEEKKVLLY